MACAIFIISNWDRKAIMMIFLAFIVLAAILQQVVGERIMPYVRLMLILLCWHWLATMLTHIEQLLRIG